MAREIGLWKKVGDAIQPVFTGGVNLLISGADRYLNFNSDTGETGYGLRDNGGTIQIKNSGGAWGNIAVGGGEANTASNLGTGGEGVFSAKAGVELQFKQLLAGTGVTLSSDGTTITITATSGGGDMAAAVYDPAAITEQLVGLTAAQTITNKTIDAANNTISNIGAAEFDTDTQDSFKFLIGCALDTPDVTVASNGTTITLSMEKSGGGDLRYSFSDGIHTHDCTPAATATLTAGSDTSPQINYVYMLQSTKALTVSTSSWPAAEHAHVATVLCQSAASLQTDGAYKVHVWTDHVQSTSGSNIQGHLAHLNEWIRYQNATWIDGAALTPTVGAGQFDIAVSAGNVLQLHSHAFPAFNTATGSDAYVVNDPTTAYKKVGDFTLANIGQDANGTTLGVAATDFYNLVVWGAVNEASGDCKLFVNVPDGAYPNDNASQASLDVDGTAIYTIPDEFKGVGFLIARLTVEENAGTYTIIQNEDLRGLAPSTAAGGAGGVGGNEFIDNVFRIQDEGDVTKQIAFQASGVTTGNTRTITMADSDIDLANTPTAGEKTVLGNTSGTNTGDETATSVAALGFTPENLDGTPDTDHSANGPQTDTFNAGATIAAGEVVYMGTGGKWLLADASVTASSEKMIGIALEAGTDTNPLLVALPGSFVRDDTWAWTAGDTLYLSLTAGDLQNTVAAVATDEVSRILGYAVSADVIYLQPQQGVIHA